MLAPAPKISTVGSEIISEHRILVEFCLGHHVVHTHNIYVTRVINNLQHHLNLEEHPLRSMGFVLMLLVTVGYLVWGAALVF